MEYTEAAEEEAHSHRELTYDENSSAANAADESNAEAGNQSVDYANHPGALQGRQGEFASIFLHFDEKTVRVGVDCVDS